MPGKAHELECFMNLITEKSLSQASESTEDESEDDWNIGVQEVDVLQAEDADDNVDDSSLSLEEHPELEIDIVGGGESRRDLRL